VSVGAEFTIEGFEKIICYLKFEDFDKVSKIDGRAQLNEVPYSDLIRQGRLKGAISNTTMVEYKD